MGNGRSGSRRYVAALGAAVVALAGLVGIGGVPAGAVPSPPTLVSSNAAGDRANARAESYEKQIVSADGRKVVFSTVANNLTGLPADSADTTNSDVYVKDRTSGAVTLVSRTAAGVKGNGWSGGAVISPDGTHVAFLSGATNLVPADSDANADVYLKDLVTGVLTLVSVGPGGERPQDVSVFAGLTLSYDGTKVAFAGGFPGDPWLSPYGVLFLRDTMSGVTTRVSTNSAGGGPVVGYPAFKGYHASMSGDATKIAFTSASYGWNPGCGCSEAVDGTIVVAPAEDPLHTQEEVFVKDLVVGTVTRVSTPSTGGRANGASSNPSLAANGSRVAFESVATNLVPGGVAATTNVYVHDLPGSSPVLAAVSTSGAMSTRESRDARLTGDGSTLVFNVSDPGSGLEPTQGSPVGVYTRNLATGTTLVAIVYGDLWPRPWGSISADGSAIVTANYVYVPNSGETQIMVSGPPTASPTIDNVAPTVSLSSPVDGAQYAVGEVVTASFSCADEVGGSGLVSCLGTVSDGGPIDTSTAGTKVFGVVARDAAGNEARRTVRYDVGAPGPVVAIFSPAAGASYPVGQTVPASYSCTAAPGGDPVASCVGTVPAGDPVDTTLGSHVFTVTATDTAGRTTTETVPYDVTGLNSATQSVGGGGTVSTGTDPTPADPFGTSVTSPNGGTVSILEQVNPSATSGYTALGAQVQITAPPASKADPLVLRFYGEGSALPPGIDHTNIAISRNGAVLPNCLGATQVPANVATACISGRAAAPSGGGDIVITVITTTASAWSLLAPLPVATPFLNAVTEGNAGTTTVGVPVSIPVAFDRAISVNFQAFDYTAKAPGDYTPSSGTVTILPGETVGFAPIAVVGDTRIEPNEAFLVAFGSPVNAKVGGSLGLGAGIITDDDDGGDVTTGYSAAEAARTAQSATYLGMTPEQLQQWSVQVVAWAIGASHAKPAPMVPPPDVSGPTTFTTTWTPADVAALRAVEAHYSLDAEQAQKAAVAVVNYVLAVQGH